MEARATKEITIMIIVTILLASFGVYIGLRLGNRGIVIPVRDLSAVSAGIAQGDLTQGVTIKSNSEIGQLGESVEQMRLALFDSVSGLRKLAKSVSDQSSSLATGAHEQEATVAEQAAAVTETTTTINELDATARETMNRTDEIVDSAQKVSERLQQLNQQAVQVEAASSQIDEISRQIRLLALDASIEASHSQDSGAFSVIASEIRTLADASQEATSRIGTVLKEVEAGAGESSMMMESTLEALKAIQLTLREQGVATSQVAASSNEISVGLEQISEVVRMSVGSTESLNSLVIDLESQLGKWKLS